MASLSNNFQLKISVLPLSMKWLVKDQSLHVYLDKELIISHLMCECEIKNLDIIISKLTNHLVQVITKIF